MPARDVPHDPIDVARHLAAALDEQGVEYALGGALALGYWGTPRSTLDVDLTLFLDTDLPGLCIHSLQQAGCDVAVADSTRMIREHGFFRADYAAFRVDVFLPIAPFYELARQRRRRFDLDGQPVMIWDAETLAVFKMMFFRDKDLVDVKQMLRTQGGRLDRAWVRKQLEETFGRRDPRVTRWDELTADIVN
jgi:hypothetical protein